MNARIFVLIVLVLTLCVTSCRKFLDAKSDKHLRGVMSLDDLKALMVAEVPNNGYSPTGLPVIASDEFYFLSSAWATQPLTTRLNYIWDNDAGIMDGGVEYRQLYAVVLNANVVLSALPTMNKNEDPTLYDNIKGYALFYRSFAFYHLAQLYCKPYSTTASVDPGIALRMAPDIETPSVRSTVQQTYDRITGDIKEAAMLLPATSAALNYNITIPNKAAAYGALARTYLSMRDYVNASKYADSCLLLYNTILDYNSIDPNIDPPISGRNNSEIIFDADINQTFRSNYLIDSALYQSYSNNDLRKTMFFSPATGGYSFKGRYIGGINFCGLATDEMYLTRAECYARSGNKDSAMADLNRLIIKRWKNSVPYPQITATDAADALNKVLIERRKELIYRGTRWMDLRRFNQEGANITLKRVLNGITYTLPPNDLRWVMLLPQNAITYSGMEQNPR